MSSNTSELSQAAYEFDRLNDEFERAQTVSIEAKEALELSKSLANDARGRLKALLTKASIDLPCTIAIEGTSRLLTVYEDGYGLGYVVTANPNPQ